MIRLGLGSVAVVVVASAAVGQTTSESLIKQLKDSAPRVRRLAAEKLGREKIGDAAPAIADLLRDTDPDVRSAARKALVRIGPKSAAPLAKALDSTEDSARLAAVQALAELGTAAEDAVPALMTALKDKNIDVRIHAAYALGQIGPAAKSALPALREAAGDTSNLGPILRMNLPSGVAESAVKASLKIDPASGPAVADAAMPALIQALSSKKSADVQAAGAAFSALGIHAKSALPALETAVPKEDSFAKSALEGAIEKLAGDRGDHERIALDPSIPVERRIRAIEKMRYQGQASEKRIAALESLLADPEPKVRLVALQAVDSSQLRSKAIIAGLVDLLDDEVMHKVDKRELSRDEVRHALTRMGKYAAPELVAVLADPKRKINLRHQVGGVLNKMGTAARGVLPQLQACTKDRYLAVVVVASCAYVRAGGDFEVVKEAIREGLRHKVPDVVQLAAWDVELLGPPAAGLVPDLTKLLEHENREVRIAAARGLSKMGAPAAKAVPAMAALLKDEDPRQRYQVTSALKEMGSHAKAAVPELITRLKDEMTWSPDPLLTTLANIGPDAADAVPALLELAKKRGRFSQQALDTLARIGPAGKEGIALCVENLDAKSPYDRKDAAKSLGEFGPVAKEAVPKLKELLEDPDESVRVWAAFALARITGDFAANIETLLSYWVPPSEPTVRLQPLSDANFDILSALVRLGPDAKPARERVHRTLFDSKASPGTHSRLCEVLRNINDESAIPKLIAHLEGAEPSQAWTLQSVLETLASFGPKAKAAKKQIEPLLDHETPEIADAAAQALRRINPPVK